MPSSLLRPSSSPRALALLATFACLLGLAGCDGAECALDSDCALGLRCNAEHRCVTRGGEERDASTATRDGGTSTDGAAPTDAAAPIDAWAAPDATDGCPALLPEYGVVDTSPGCESRASVMFFVRDDVARCAYVTSSDLREDLVGTFTLDESGGFQGNLSFADAMVGRICSVAPQAYESGFSIDCGSCAITLAPRRP